MGNVTISQAAAWLVAAAAAIVGVKNAWDIIKKVFHPEADLRQRMDNQDKKIAKHDEMLENDNQRFKKIEAKLDDTDVFKGVMCRAMLAQLEDGDEAGRKEAKKELNQYLTKR